MIKSIISLHKSFGYRGLLVAIFSRLFAKKARNFQLCKQLLANGCGLEIGGPSTIFRKRRILPIYPTLCGLDNCNFSDCTIWEGNISPGTTFKYDKNRPLGKQYILEATDLNQIEIGAYDFILSSHVIEHIANPLLALYEWIRVLRVEGILVLIVPHKDGTFDHKRSVTTLSHIIKDYELGTKESDLTHLQEILELHDLKKDPEIKDAVTFMQRSKNNFTNRCLHHHVFNTPIIVEIIHHVNLQILSVEAMLPYHIIIVARKISTGQYPDNDLFLGNTAEYRHLSPFDSDKHTFS